MLYQTHKTAASVRRAFEDFTHVVVNRSYHINKPVFLRTAPLADLPIFVFQPWKEEAAGQLAKWREKGGVLIDATHDGAAIGRRDVTVIAEAPLSMQRLDVIRGLTDQYVVSNVPDSWKTHQSVTDLKAPTATRLKEVRATIKTLPNAVFAPSIREVSRYPDSRYVCTDEELAYSLGVPLKEAQTLRRSLKPQEVWCVRPRLEPEAPALLAVWRLVLALPDAGGGKRFFTRLEGHFRMWRRALKEMARLGHIGLQRYQVYPTKEPDYKKLAAAHKVAAADFKAVQKLLESAPQHLP